MIVAALTGSIAMGKSETAKMFVRRGIPVFDSDAAVHELYAKGGEAVPFIRSIEPSAIIDDAVDRNVLADKIRNDPALLRQIEAVVHPLVRVRQARFISDSEKNGQKIVVLDIPLLFETKQEGNVDMVIVVSADPQIQRERALKRPGMTAEKLEFILSRQVPDAEKRERADFIIDTSVDLETTARRVDEVILELERLKEAGS